MMAAMIGDGTERGDRGRDGRGCGEAHPRRSASPGRSSRGALRQARAARASLDRRPVQVLLVRKDGDGFVQSSSGQPPCV
jgi:hypothetical protein